MKASVVQQNPITGIVTMLAGASIMRVEARTMAEAREEAFFVLRNRRFVICSVEAVVVG